MKHQGYRVVLGLALFSNGCASTTHHASPGTLGHPSTLEAMETELDRPGPVTIERIVAADWTVDLGGMLDLDDARAKAAGLEDRPEPIHLYLYVLRHPKYGAFLVDSGIQAAFRTGERTIVAGLVASFMNTDALVVHHDTAKWLSSEETVPAGVLMTHLHLDHILGLPDLPTGTKVYVGPGEAEDSKFGYLFTQGTTDRALDGKDLRSLPASTPDGGFAGVLDLFGDGSVWALHAPGHTAGSLIFIVRSTEGPAMMVGDTCHTAWGWDHDVTPGTFTADHEKNAESLAAARALAERHPTMRVYLGHQEAHIEP